MGPELNHDMKRYALGFVGATWLAGSVTGAAQDTINRSIQSLEQRMELVASGVLLHGMVRCATPWSKAYRIRKCPLLMTASPSPLMPSPRCRWNLVGRCFATGRVGCAGIHEWALELASVDGKITYPTLAVFNAQNEILFQHGGLLGEERSSQF